VLSEPCGTNPNPPARYKHVVWIVMENKGNSDVIGSSIARAVAAEDSCLAQASRGQSGADVRRRAELRGAQASNFCAVAFRSVTVYGFQSGGDGPAR
jgi:hypothetical protein